MKENKTVEEMVALETNEEKLKKSIAEKESAIKNMSPSDIFQLLYKALQGLIQSNGEDDFVSFRGQFLCHLTQTSLGQMAQKYGKNWIEALSVFSKVYENTLGKDVMPDFTWEGKEILWVWNKESKKWEVE